MKYIDEKRYIKDKDILLKINQATTIFLTAVLVVFVLIDFIVPEEPTYIPAVLITAEAVIAAGVRANMVRKKKKADFGKKNINVKNE